MSFAVDKKEGNVMEDTLRNSIIRLAIHYGRKSMPDEEPCSPEAVLLGLAKVATLSDGALTFAMKELGIADTEEIRKDIKEIKSVLESRKLDTGLIRNGMESLLPFIPADDKGADKLEKTLSGYDEKTPVDTIVKDIVSAIDPDELKVFGSDKEAKDVREYINDMREKYSTRNPFTGESDESIKTEPDKAAMKTQKKETENTGEIEIFSEKLNSYLNDLKRIVPEFVKAGCEELLWRRSLILSIDDGFGFTTFAHEIERIYKDNGLVGNYMGNSIVNEVKPVLQNPLSANETPYLEYEEQLIKELGDVTDRKKVYSIQAIDLSEMCGQINEPRFKEMIRCIEDNCDSAVVLFRIPYLVRHTVAEIADAISDVMTVETIMVPPLTVEGMLDYMHRRAKKFCYTFDKECDELLEQAVIYEKNDGRFYGFRTLNKIVDSAIISMLSDPASAGKKSRKITAGRLKDYINCEVPESDYNNILDDMIGVDGIIETIDKAIKQIRVEKDLYEKGKEIERPSIHMMFRGNPGTGKTTIARIVAAKMKEAGILSKGSFFEKKGRDLCGSYVGHTTPKTVKICMEAYGSVLFLDEAYALYRGGDRGGNDYGMEALDALVAEMENHRDDMCVIMAGYPDEMDTMLSGNPGMKSRIPIVIDFPNYNRQQLEEIFFKMMDGHFKYEDGVKEAAHKFFESLSDDVIESKEFSNGRFVRNLFESVWGEAAVRYDLGGDDELIIRTGDFEAATKNTDISSMVEKKTRPIGFVV